jgi:hypothetical protein
MVAAQSSPIDDIDDEVEAATRIQVVNESLAVNQEIDSVLAAHAVYPDKSNANSVYPVCAAFDFIQEFTQCFDSADNDGDGLADIDDPACHTDGDASNIDSYDKELDDENSVPVISLLGDAIIELTEGEDFEDPGASAYDEEDGDITENVVIGGDTVSSSTPAGTYLISYNVSDSQGVEAEEVSRTVIVNDKETNEDSSNGGGGNGGGGGGGSGDGGGGMSVPEEKTQPNNVPANGPPGFSGNPQITPQTNQESLNIYDEKIDQVVPTAVLVEWKTNIPAASRVAYDTVSHGDAELPENYGYNFLTPIIFASTTEHSVTIGGLDSEKQYFFRPISKKDDLEAIGKEMTFTLTPPVEVSSGECDYLLEYLRFGKKNNPVEVMKLQLFLKNFEGFTDLSVSGFFDRATFDAVSAFQKKYMKDVLEPWDLDAPTGYVYITTKKKINEIYCRKEFPLTPDQKDEIKSFRDTIKMLKERRQDTIDIEREVGVIFNETDEIVEKNIQEIATRTLTIKTDSDVFQKNESGKGIFSAALTFAGDNKFLSVLVGVLIIALFAFFLYALISRRKFKKDSF